MKKILLFVACALGLSACNMTGGQQQDAMQQERDSLQRIINEKDIEVIIEVFMIIENPLRRKLLYLKDMMLRKVLKYCFNQIGFPFSSFSTDKAVDRFSDVD